MKKILVYNSNNFPSGIEDLLKKILNNLGANSEIFYYSTSKPTKEIKAISKFKYKKYSPRWQVGKNGFILFLFFPLFQFLFFLKIIKSRISGVKKIICFGLTEKILSFIPCKILGIEIYWVEWDILDFFDKKNFWKLIYRLFAKKTLIIVAAEKIKQQLIKIKIKEININLIYPGIDIEKFLQKNIINHFTNPDIFRVGTICKLDSNKGIEQMMQAIKIAQNFIPNIRLTIVGDGTERKSLFWLAKKLEIAEITQFSGFQSDLNSWISSFEIFIYPTLKQKSFSLTILQAMAYARPVLIFDVGALGEAVIHNQTGIVIKKGDSKEMAQAIIDLHRHQNALRQMGEAGRTLVKEKFDFNKNIQQWQKIILQ